MTTGSLATPYAALLAAWETQQAAYVAGREARFTVMADLVAATLGSALHENPTSSPRSWAVDLGCGPGSFSARLLDHFGSLGVVAVDLDPVMTTLARRALERFGERAVVVEGDLATGAWMEALGDRPLVAAVSTTAIHWLSAPNQLALYTAVAQRLEEGGVLVNGDHQPFAAHRPTLRRIAADHDAATQQAAYATGAIDWDHWWQQAEAIDELAPIVASRHQLFAERPPSTPTPVEFHLAALRQAGFAEVATAWQYLDDYVLYARR